MPVPPLRLVKNAALENRKNAHKYSNGAANLVAHEVIPLEVVFSLAARPYGRK
jgi:hypothetical protein